MLTVDGGSKYPNQCKDAVECLTFGVRFIFASRSTTLDAVTNRGMPTNTEHIEKEEDYQFCLQQHLTCVIQRFIAREKQLLS